MKIQRTSMQNKQTFGNIVALLESDDSSLFKTLFYNKNPDAPFRTDFIEKTPGKQMLLISTGEEKKILDIMNCYFFDIDPLKRSKARQILGYFIYDLLSKYSEIAKKIKVNSFEDIAQITGLQDIAKYIFKK